MLKRCFGLLTCCVFAYGITAAAEENWPQWRGANMDGVSDATGLPVTWSETENVVWKAPLPSWSGSTPIIWGDRIFVASPSKAEGNAEMGGASLLLLCLSKKDGSVLWERELDKGNVLNSKQNASSPSPATDGKCVYAMTGTGAVVGMNMDGEVLWKHNLQTDYGPFGLNFGYGASPLLYNGKLIIAVIHGYTTKAPSYLLAYDTADGKLLWRVERPSDAVLESPDAYITPVVLHFEGKDQIIVTGADYVTGHDVETGKEVWRAGGLNPRHFDRARIIVSPLAVDGLVYAQANRRPMLVLRGGGSGDVTTSHLVWSWDKPNGPDVPTPSCDGKSLYMVDDHSVMTCLNAKTGETIWGPEHTTPGIVSASPLLADGKIYFTNEEAVTTVVKAGPAFAVLAANKLDNAGGRTLSSFAVSGNQLFLRTATHLYCLGNKAK